MSKAKSKTELVRLAWIAALRREGHRQCSRVYRDNDGNVCALGLLAEVGTMSCYDMAEIGALAGLDYFQAVTVACMSDGVAFDHPHTFAEIADIVEGWFSEVT
jgi:hypothetical protein